MITIRIEEDENLITVLNEETAIDCNDCVDINKDFNSLTIQDCLNIYYQKVGKKRCWKSKILTRNSGKLLIQNSAPALKCRNPIYSKIDTKKEKRKTAKNFTKSERNTVKF